MKFLKQHSERNRREGVRTLDLVGLWGKPIVMFQINKYVVTHNENERLEREREREREREGES